MLTLEQLQEWEAYDKLDPVGTWRDDFRMAYLASLIQNIVLCLYPKKGEKPKLTTPSDFMPVWDEELRKIKSTPKKQSPEEMKHLLLALARSQNKKFTSRKDLEKQKKEA